MEDPKGSEALDGALGAKLARVAELTPHAVVLTDALGHVQWVNAEFTKLTEISLEEALGLAPRNLMLFTDPAPEIVDAIAQAVITRRGLRTEVHIQNRSGRAFWIDLDLRPMFTEEGGFDGYMAFWTETTRTKRLEVRLERQAAQLRSTSELARIGGWEADMATGVSYLSPELCKMMAWPSEVVTKDAMRAMYDPETFAMLETLFARAVDAGERLEYRAKGVTGAGQEVWLKVFGEPVFSEGRCVAIRGASQDVTAEHLTERALRESESFAQGAIDGIAAALAVLDENGVVIAFNKAFAQSAAAVGLPEDFALGLPIEDLLATLPRRYAQKLGAGLRSMLCGAQTEYRVTFKNRIGADQPWMQLHASRFEWEGVARCVLITDSIDEVKRSEGRLRELNAGLRKARQAADAANAAKSSFLATMSHEIRTPLNAVLGMAEAMANDDLPEVQRGRLEVVRQAGGALLGLLNDLLDLAKIEAGKLELEEGLVNMEEVAAGVRAAFSALADGKAIELQLSVEPSASGLWSGDPGRVRQIVYNLVGNAVKFTTRGGVKVDVAHGRDGLVIQVRDTGVGISADRCATVFDKFVQADASTTRRYGGSGLGLAICRELAGLMKGEITLDSVEGRGSTFTVRLPLTRAEQALSEPRAAAPGPMRKKALRVLAAEDNPMNQMVLKTLLAQVGINPHMVDDGEQALQVWARGCWDVILMDVQMPVMDGPTAARQIRGRELAEGRPRTPIIALTANAMTHHAAEYRASGMDAVASKPIEFAKLMATIEDLLGRETAAPAASKRRAV